MKKFKKNKSYNTSNISPFPFIMSRYKYTKMNTRKYPDKPFPVKLPYIAVFLKRISHGETGKEHKHVHTYVTHVFYECKRGVLHIINRMKPHNEAYSKPH